MKARIVVSTSGQIGVFADDGTFAEGAAAIEKLFTLLEAGGVELEDVKPVEQHRHDGVNVPVNETIRFNPDA